MAFLCDFIGILGSGVACILDGRVIIKRTGSNRAVSPCCSLPAHVLMVGVDPGAYIAILPYVLSSAGRFYFKVRQNF